MFPVHKGQDTEELAQLRNYAARQGWTWTEYIDNEAGNYADRSAFRALFTGASRREFDVVLVWALDRLRREGVAEMFTHIARLSSYAVKFESFTESHFRAQACLARIERLNPVLNALITVTSDEALQQAREAEAEIRKGGWRGPLHGVPIARNYRRSRLFVGDLVDGKWRRRQERR